jgi:NADH:ubiquinone oxidoreductase subunit H
MAQKGGILNWYWVPLFPMMIIFFISSLVETSIFCQEKHGKCHTRIFNMRATDNLRFTFNHIKWCPIAVVMIAGSVNLNDIVMAQKGGILNWYWVPLFPMMIIFFISALVETNRAPYQSPTHTTN